MIRSFKDFDTRSLFLEGTSKRWKHIERVALRKLHQINSAARLTDLRVPPGNQLEALKDDRKGQHSIRVNDQYRICFTWRDSNAEDVEITKHYR